MIALLALSAAFLSYCKSDASKQDDRSKNLLAVMQNFSRNFCGKDSNCVVFNYTYPVFTGGTPGQADAMNAEIEKSVLGFAFPEAAPEIPFLAALDTAAARLINEYKTMYTENPLTFDQSWSNELSSFVVVSTPKIITINMYNTSYLGGAHPNTFAQPATYDLATAKLLLPNQMVNDTTALLALLESAYKKQKGLSEKDNIKSLLLEGIERLPMPQHAAILPTGISFYYNAYEVAPYAVGPANIILSWTQLGPLANREKWQ